MTGIYDSFYCPEYSNFSLLGDDSSTVEKQQYISITTCNNDTLEEGVDYKCASQEEIEKMAENIYITFVVMNQYFDQNEFHENPLKFMNFIRYSNIKLGFSIGYDL